MTALPLSLKGALRPITLIAGHYGVGKTNLTCNLALDLAKAGEAVTVVDLDIVNPYFRASEQRRLLEGRGVRLIAPVFAEAGSSLDVPSLRGSIQPALDSATPDAPVLVDVGGDDAGTIALGRFRSLIAESDYALLGVVNAFRNLVKDPEAAAENLREIESAGGLAFTALVDNSHLKGQTDIPILEEGYRYAKVVAGLMGLPLVAVTAPEELHPPAIPDELILPVHPYVKNPWE